jgi:hypothetical protein
MWHSHKATPVWQCYAISIGVQRHPLHHHTGRHVRVWAS